MSTREVLLSLHDMVEKLVQSNEYQRRQIERRIDQQRTKQVYQ